MVSIVVVLSLVLSSCGGNKNSGSVVSGLGRNVQLSIFENDIKTVEVAGDVVRHGSTMKLVGSRFEKCDFDEDGEGEVVCVNKGSTSTVRFKNMLYDGKLLEGKDLQCALVGGGKGCGKPLLVTCKKSQQAKGSEVCVSPEIRFQGTRVAVSSEQKEAAEEKKATDRTERAEKYEKIKGTTIDEAVDKAHSIVEHCALETDYPGEKNSSKCRKAIGSYDNLNASIHDIYLEGVTDKDFKAAEKKLNICKERNTTFVDSWSGNDKRNRVCALEVARVNDLNERKEEYEKAAADYMKEIIEHEPDLLNLLDSSDFYKEKAGNFSLLNHMKDDYWHRNGYFGGALKGIKSAVSWWESGVTNYVLPYLGWGRGSRGWWGIPALAVNNLLSSLLSPAILPLALGAYRLKYSPLFTDLPGLKYFYSKSELEAGWKSKTSEIIMPFAPNLIIMAGCSIWNAVRSLVFAGNGPEVSVGDVMKESSSHNALELGIIGLAEIGLMQVDREFYRKDGIWPWIKKTWNAEKLGKEEKEVKDEDLSSDEEIEEEGGECEESECEESECEDITSVKQKIKKRKGGSSVSDNTTKKSSQQNTEKLKDKDEVLGSDESKSITNMKKKKKKGKSGSSVSDNTTKKSPRQNTEKLKDEEDSEGEVASLIKRIPTPDGLGFFARWRWRKDRKAVGSTFEQSKDEKRLKKQQKKAADAEAKRKSDREKLREKGEKLIEADESKIKKLIETRDALKQVFRQEHNANASSSSSSSSSSLSSSSSTNANASSSSSSSSSSLSSSSSTNANASLSFIFPSSSLSSSSSTNANASPSFSSSSSSLSSLSSTKSSSTNNDDSKYE
jgi:hypothetical protein